MALNPKLTSLAATTEANAVAALLNNGWLRLYSGSQPSTADEAVTSQVVLAELRFGNPAFGSASDGVAAANAVTGDASANATGTATWFRCCMSDGATPVFDGSVGTSNSNLVLNSVEISEGAPVDVTSFTFTAQKG
jgi:hypothetical protein